MVSSGNQSWCYLISIPLVSSFVQGEFIYVVPSLVEWVYCRSPDSERLSSMPLAIVKASHQGFVYS